MTTEPTAADRPALEISVTLTTGRLCRFAVDDSAAAQRLLKEMQPARLFSTSPTLLLSGGGALTVFPVARVERVDIVGAALPAWPFLGGATAVREVSETEFLAAYDPLRFAEDRREARAARIGFTEYWTVSGQHVFWEVRMESLEMTAIDFKPYIQSLFAAGGLHASTAEGGIAVLNPANLLSMTFHPGPPLPPAGAWVVRRL